MATTAKTYLDLEGLKSYDALIKSWSNSANQLGFKTVLESQDGNKILFYKKPNAILGTDTPDKEITISGGDISKKLDELAEVAGATWNSTKQEYEISLDPSFVSASKTIVSALNELKAQINTLNSENTVEGSVKYTVKNAIEALDVNELPLATISGGIVKISGIKQVDGKISKEGVSEVTLAKVAGTGAAADVSYTATIGSTPVTNVDDALDILAQASSEGVESKTVYITETPGGSTSAYSKRYTVYQGATGTISSPVVSEKLVDIDIPKDMVVEEGEVVNIVFKSSDNTLHEGTESGPDVTAAIKGSDPATAADAGKYIKLIIANATSDTLYIKATDFVDIYTGGTNAETTVNVDNSTRVITASVNTIDSAKVAYTSGVNVKLALNRINGGPEVEGSIRNIAAGAISSAIVQLATPSPVAIATYQGAATSGAATTITITTGISESNGIVEGEEDTITLTTISDDELASLFS